MRSYALGDSRISKEAPRPCTCTSIGPATDVVAFTSLRPKIDLSPDNHIAMNGRKITELVPNGRSGRKSVGTATSAQSIRTIVDAHLDDLRDLTLYVFLTR